MPYFLIRLSLTVEQVFLHLTHPVRHSMALSVATDLPRSKSQLIAENALLRQQSNILHRQVKTAFHSVGSPWAGPPRQPRSTLETHSPHPATRNLIALASARFSPLLEHQIPPPRRSSHLSHRNNPLDSADGQGKTRFGVQNAFVVNCSNWTFGLPQRPSADISDWYALPVPLVKPGQSFSTIMRKMSGLAISCPWSTCSSPKRVSSSSLNWHPGETFTLTSRRIPRMPGSHNNCEATPHGQTPRFLIRDRDSKQGQTFRRVAKGSGIEILRTPYRVPKANAICERFLGSVRRECLDYMLILRAPLVSGDQRIRGVLQPGSTTARDRTENSGGHCTEQSKQRTGKIIAFPALNGLDHDYRRAA